MMVLASHYRRNGQSRHRLKTFNGEGTMAQDNALAAGGFSLIPEELQNAQQGVSSIARTLAETVEGIYPYPLAAGETSPPAPTVTADLNSAGSNLQFLALPADQLGPDISPY